MELRKLLKIAWKWAWLAVLAVAIAATTSYYATQSITPLYRTSTTLMIGTAIQDPRGTGWEIIASREFADTFIQLVNRENVLAGTVEALNLDMDWRALRGQVSAVSIPNTSLMEIRVIDADPFRAKVLADEVARQLILQSPAAGDNDPEQAAFAQEQLNELKDNIESGQEELIRLNQELDVAISARQIQDLENQVNILNNKISNWQFTYAQLLLSVQGGANRLSLVEAAVIPTAPFSPNVQRNVMVAAIIGLALAVLGVTLIEYLEDTLKTPEEFTEITGLPALGAISHIGGKTYPEKLITVTEPFSPVVESYRILRTNLQFAFIDQTLRTLSLTSQGPEEGKSVTLANLAVVLAQTGREVIVVDADLRRPVQHLIFELNNRVGLTSALLNTNPSKKVMLSQAAPVESAPSLPETVDPERESTDDHDRHETQKKPADLSDVQNLRAISSQKMNPITDYLQNTKIKNLRFLSSGPLPPNPSELVGSERMVQLIERLKAEAEVILIDAPPMMVTDAAILGSHVDGTILVIESGRTRAADIRQAMDELNKGQINLVGGVINRMGRKSGGYYYYRRYHSAEEGENVKKGKKKGKRKNNKQEMSEKLLNQNGFLPNPERDDIVDWR